VPPAAVAVKVAVVPARRGAESAVSSVRVKT